jgi:site-specific DNA-methyltransferase (adenine-specific)/adenine-specific DNA-methyltransferase
MYEITSPTTGKKFKPPEGSCWKVIESEYQRLLAEGRMYFGKNGNAMPQRIQYQRDIEGIAPWTWWPHEEVGHTDESRKEVQSILGTQTAFDTPKPTRLIQRILQIATDKDSLILDSFAGSGATGHGVLRQNAEDGGNRRFILVEMDENIARNVTAERVKRAAGGYVNAKGQQVEGLGGGFQFCRLSTEPLFTAEGQIRPDVTFAQLAEFVWFAETGGGFPNPHANPCPGGRGARELSPLLGVHEGRAIYLLYNGILKDRSAAGGNVLTAPVLNLLPPFDGPRVIYAAACRLGSARLLREGITFKQTPYALEV